MNKELKKKSAKKYYDKNADKERARSLAWYHKNKERILRESKERYRANPKPKSDYNRRRRFKLTQQELVSFFESRDGKCEICSVEGKVSGYGSLCVDHNHTTQKVRGLLCTRCNLGLHFTENEEWAAKAVAYLKKYEGTS